MNAINKAREDRTRNLARLRQLTIGTAALSVAATAGFGYLAAVTYTGTTTGATAAVSTTRSTAASTATSANTAIVPSIISTTRTAHVSSGGS